MTSKLPPPFEIGQSYLDGKGEYTVVSLGGNRIRTRHADGTERVEDADLKARIHRRILLERTGRRLTLAADVNRTGVARYLGSSRS